MWLEKPREEREGSVCALPCRLKILAELLQHAEREYPEYCEESWQRLKGTTIMSYETLVEKLNEAVCCRVCNPHVTLLENVNCQSSASSNKEVYRSPTACICERTFSLRS